MRLFWSWITKPGISVLVVYNNYCQLSTKCTQTSLGHWESVVQFRLAWWALLKVSQIYFPSVFVRRREKNKTNPDGKTNTDMQTDHITEFVPLSSHFSSFMVSLCFSEEEKKQKKKTNSCMTSGLELITATKSILTVLTPALPPSASGNK